MRWRDIYFGPLPREPLHIDGTELCHRKCECGGGWKAFWDNFFPFITFLIMFGLIFGLPFWMMFSQHD